LKFFAAAPAASLTYINIGGTVPCSTQPCYGSKTGGIKDMTITFCVSTVKELMTSHPEMISPNATLLQAARKMEAVDCGALPVGTANNLKGIITDRDIVIRALAHGKNPTTEKVSGYMTENAYACNEQDSIEDASEKMRQYKVSRLIVQNKEGRVTGILSFGGILRNDATPAEIVGAIKHARNAASA
jgi:CBS domain-containing protein